MIPFIPILKTENVDLQILSGQIIFDLTDNTLKVDFEGQRKQIPLFNSADLVQQIITELPVNTALLARLGGA